MKRAAIILILTAGMAAAPEVWGADASPAAGTASVSPATQPTRANSTSNSERQNRRRRTRRSTNAADTPNISGANDPAPLGSEFELLTERSIFMKGRLPRNFGSGDAGPAAAEDQLVFNGVTETDHQTVAFIEDTSTGKVQIVPVGEAIAQGKITKITLDGLDYQSSDGRTAHVQVGQNLRGRDAWNQIYGMGSETTETPSNEPPPDSAMAAIIQRMKQKRLAEMGGGASSGTAAAPGATTAPSARR